MGASSTSGGIGKNEDSVKLTTLRYRSAWGCRLHPSVRSYKVLNSDMI
jgi:hypothetical protein